MIAASIINRYAPMVYLHPYDNHRPTSVEAFFAKTRLYASLQRQELAAQVTADTLVQFNQPDYYLDFPQQTYPTAANDFSSGDVLAPGSDPSYGVCRAPMYVKVFERDSFVDIKYAFFYEWNGPQMFRVGVRSGFTTRKRTFMWHRFARHMGDWEHITVRLNRELTTIQKVYYGQHNRSMAVDRPPLVDGSHPVVYSGLSSHASYAEQEIHTEEEIDAAVITGAIAWLKVVDTTQPNDVVVYRQQSPLYSRVEWAPYKHGGGLVMVDADQQAAKWMRWQGRFGPTMDNSNIDRPPELTLGAENHLFNFAKVAKGMNLLKSKMRQDGPASPEQQGWWNAKEP